MSPLGKPEGGNPRHYSGKHGTLGTLLQWNCPSCGQVNDAQPLAHGCVHCGVGDQRKNSAGQQKGDKGWEAEEPDVVNHPPATKIGGAYDPNLDLHVTKHAVTTAAPTTIYRLIEYQIRPGANYAPVLRNSLVGSLEMAWGTITGTIVDTVDAQQEDRLRMARMQPGVWLANQEAMTVTTHPSVIDRFAENAAARYPARAIQRAVTSPVTPRKETRMEMPETGPQFSVNEQQTANRITNVGYEGGGYRLANTLALALGSIAEELEGNSEPLKFLSRAECLSLANALLHQLPTDWAPEPPEDAGDAEYAVEPLNRTAVQERLVVKPVATYTEPEDRRGGGL